MPTDSEALESTLQTKLTQLEITQEKTGDVLKTEKISTIARHIETLKNTLTDVENARRTVEAQKIAAHETTQEIKEWNAGVEAQVEQADKKLEILEEWLHDQKLKQETYEREEPMQFEIKLHGTKLKLQEELEQEKNVARDTPNTQAKLPKLVISKFNGSFADWPRFWGQYSEIIDKSSVPPVTKFSYLRELLDHKVKKAVEGLRHTAEGYNRAVSILRTDLERKVR